MLRITPSVNAAAAKQYYTQGLTKSDYYIDGQELPGVWGGKGAELLQLKGEVDQKAYFALCENIDPNTGEQLTPRMNDNRRVGYDFTFSVPKSVSVMYEVTGDERILKAAQDSIRETMASAEKEMKARVRANGANEDRVTGNMVWAEFTHFTSRPVDGKPDPHLHTHVFVFNATHDGERWKAGQFGDLKRDAPYWEAEFDARMCRRLNELGYPVELRGLSYEIASVPQSVIDKFSRRRDAIEKEAEKRGIENPEGKHAIGRKGREAKAEGVSKSELRKEWSARLTKDEASDMHGTENADTTGRPMKDDSVRYAIKHCFERQSTISEKRLKVVAMKHGVGSVLPDEIDAPNLIKREVDGETLVTTMDVLKQEERMIGFARRGRGVFDELGDVRKLPHGLSAEQGAAAAKVLHSRDRVVAVRGAAGTGKTFMMEGTIAAMDKPVHVFAPSARASRGVLREEGFKDAETLERLLVDESYQKRVKGGVIWVDEAGMIGNADMSRLFDVAEKQNARIVLSGDYRQHGSVRAGDAFRILQSEAGVTVAEMKNIRRQKHAGYRKAVESISKGTPEGALVGFKELDSMGMIVEGGDRHAMLVADYQKAAQDGKTALIIAPTHAEGETLSGAVRRSMDLKGERSVTVAVPTMWTEAQKGDVRNYEPGMVVEFYQNAKGFRRGERAVVTRGGSVLRQNGEVATLPVETERFQVYRTGQLPVAIGERIRIRQNGKTMEGKRINNGDLFTVTGFTKQGDMKLSNGQTLPKGYMHIGHGYTDTSYASQGKTVDRVFIALGDESIRAANQQQWYVSVSRGRESCKVYVDSKQDVRDAIVKSNRRLAAVELVKERIDRGRRTREPMERQWNSPRR